MLLYFGLSSFFPFFYCSRPTRRRQVTQARLLDLFFFFIFMGESAFRFHFDSFLVLLVEQCLLEGVFFLCVLRTSIERYSWHFNVFFTVILKTSLCVSYLIWLLTFCLPTAVVIQLLLFLFVTQFWSFVRAFLFLFTVGLCFFLSSSKEPCGTRSLPTVESKEHNLIVTTEPKTLVGFSFNCLFYLTETWWIWVGYLDMRIYWVCFIYMRTKIAKKCPRVQLPPFLNDFGIRFGLGSHRYLLILIRFR